MLQWPAVTDPDGVVDAYYVYRDGAFLAEVTGTSHIDTTTVPGAHHAYQIQAFNRSGFASLVGPAAGMDVPADDGRAVSVVVTPASGVAATVDDGPAVVLPARFEALTTRGDHVVRFVPAGTG